MAVGWKKDYLRYKDFFLNVLRLYKNKPNFKIYLELILSLSAIVIFSIFAIRPTIITVSELNKEIKGKEETVAKLKEKINNLQTASVNLQKESSRLSLITQAVPALASPEILVKQIETLASQDGVTILRFSASDVLLVGKKEDIKKSKDFVSLSGDADELPFSISVTGPYQNLYSFLKSVENLRRPVKVDSFSITSSVTDLSKVLTLTITGRLPFLYEEK
ncbi:MAG: type 4a pilus biogenesis protein PilO [Candidatus Woesebacteria bacterium]|nr:type 4a pilus biogenesis protein PilO [Candidatus Woesebacteria bacterium]